MRIPDGKYTAVARQWDLGLSKISNSDHICVQFEITEGPFAGQCLKWWGHFSDKTTARTMESLRFCGWKNDDIANMEGMGDLLVQIVVESKIQSEGKHAGEEFSEIRWVNRLGGGGPLKLEKPMDQSQRRMFAAKMKLHAKGAPVQAGGYAAPKPGPIEKPPERDPGEDDGRDDIPF